MGGINIDLIIAEAFQSAAEFWHDLTGGELVWVEISDARSLDIFQRMEIANLSGVTFRG